MVENSLSLSKCLRYNKAGDVARYKEAAVAQRARKISGNALSRPHNLIQWRGILLTSRQKSRQTNSNWELRRPRLEFVTFFFFSSNCKLDTENS